MYHFDIIHNRLSKYAIFACQIQELNSMSTNKPACFTADLIITMTTGVESRRPALFITDHLHRILLQPSDQLLYQPKLDQLPRRKQDILKVI